MIHIETDLTVEQEKREQSQRDAALGHRLRSVQEGHLGPVIRRWVNADVAPIASLLRSVAGAYISGDMERVSLLLDAPTAELSQIERPLAPLMEWCLRGKSPGRIGTEEVTSFADDLVLTFMATALSLTVNPPEGRAGSSLSQVLANCADSLRDTVLGQFITSIQGASAMQAIRERNPELWKQKKSLNRICAQLVSQVKPQLREEERGERVLEMRGHKKVLKVMQDDKERRIELIPPDATAWAILSLCWSERDSGATSEQRPLWLGFAGVLLSAAQKTGGWFDVGEDRTRRRGHTRTTKLLCLSDRAHEAIKRDAERWIGMGFVTEPMVVPPVDGDYLTVKHRKVTGQKAPLGLGTNPEETTPWTYGACALADTPWTVNPYSLGNPSVGEMEAPAALMRVAAHRRMGATTFYLPVMMDFRGRTYYQTSWISPQTGDLGKSLLAFPLEGKAFEGAEVEYRAQINSVVMHMAGLYGGPDKLDKAPLSDRLTWWWSLDREAKVNAAIAEADKPLTFRAHWELIQSGETDRIPIQLDGTCNGLQHLSALFRDPEGAKHVNLVRSTLDDAPSDIYGVVAEIVKVWLNGQIEGGVFEDWVSRMIGAGLTIGRGLTKKPVMTLPYGGTREAVRLAVKAFLLEEFKDLGKDTPWHRYVGEGNYEAFSERDLHDHPLFNQDAGHLSALIWDSIAPAIPKAMQAMQALQALGSFVGERGMSWRVGLGPVEKRLWVTQAKSKAEQKRVTMKGFHLPSMVRRLTLNAHSNEVDPKAHRTGIVANFIHSQDAAHLAATVQLFRGRGGGCVGSVHDCLMVRPSEASLMSACLRSAFVSLYEEDPLSQPVRLIDRSETTIDFGGSKEYPSWYALAADAGVEFPERGSFDIREVLESAWFFS